MISVYYKFFTQFGDASGIQSPVSFGGFGSLTRHLGRLSNGIHIHSQPLRQYTCCLHYITFISWNIYSTKSSDNPILQLKNKRNLWSNRWRFSGLRQLIKAKSLYGNKALWFCAITLSSLPLISLKPFVFWTTAKLECIMAVSKSNVCKATTWCFPWLHQRASPCKFQLHAGI